MPGLVNERTLRMLNYQWSLKGLLIVLLQDFVEVRLTKADVCLSSNQHKNEVNVSSHHIASKNNAIKSMVI